MTTASRSAALIRLGRGRPLQALGTGSMASGLATGFGVPPSRAAKTGSRPSRTASEAATKPSNSGCGRSGRDLNSGWN